MDIQVFFDGLRDVFTAGRKTDVDAYLQKSFEQAREESDDRYMLAVLNEMAGYYRSTSDYSKGIAAGSQALLLLMDMGLEGSSAYGITLLNTATVYRAAGDASTALEMYQTAQQILEKELSPSDNRLAGLYNNIGQVHQELGDDAQALVFLEKAEQILSLVASNSTERATVLANMALLLLHLYRESDAQELLDRACALFAKHTGNGQADPHYASCLATMGQAAYQLKAYDTALDYYEKALAILDNAYGKNKDYAISCRNSATVLAAMGKDADAETYRQEANSILNGLGMV